MTQVTLFIFACCVVKMRKLLLGTLLFFSVWKKKSNMLLVTLNNEWDKFDYTEKMLQIWIYEGIEEKEESHEKLALTKKEVKENDIKELDNKLENINRKKIVFHEINCSEQSLTQD